MVPAEGFQAIIFRFALNGLKSDTFLVSNVLSCSMCLRLKLEGAAEQARPTTREKKSARS